MKFDAETIRHKKRAAYTSVGIGVVLFGLKMSGYLITGSSAILSDAMESVVHVFATSFAAYSVVLSSRPPDPSHPYGHGKIEHFSAGLEGGLIVIAALAILYTAVPALFNPPDLPNLGWGTTITALAGVTNLLLGWYLVGAGRKYGSLTLVADGKHVLTDSYTSIGVVIGLLLVISTGYRIIDPLLAVAVAVNIIVTGSKLIRHSVGELMHEADADTIGRMTAVLNEQRKHEWISVHRMRCWKSGDTLHLDFHLTLPYYLDIATAHELEEDIDGLLSASLDGPMQLLIHHDPCVPACCSFCSMPACTPRKHEFLGRADFDPQEVVKTAPYAVD